jgi:hypothetical protein
MARLGEIVFDVPQVREGGFYLGALEKVLRSERALTLALAEMYVQGVSLARIGDPQGSGDYQASMRHVSLLHPGEPSCGAAR